MENENALTCSHCNYQPENEAKNWRKCVKCGMLWCPKCAPSDSDQCVNCIGGKLVAVEKSHE